MLGSRPLLFKTLLLQDASSKSASIASLKEHCFQRTPLSKEHFRQPAGGLEEEARVGELECLHGPFYLATAWNHWLMAHTGITDQIGVLDAKSNVPAHVHQRIPF